MCQVSRATVCGLVRGIMAGSRWDMCIGLLGSLVVSTVVRGRIQFVLPHRVNFVPWLVGVVVRFGEY